MSCERTIGEQRFEAYLKAMQHPFEFEKEYPGKQRRPDYTVTRNGIFLLDVKNADPFMPLGFNQYDPHEPIFQRINAGRKKFKEFKGFPAALCRKTTATSLWILSTRRLCPVPRTAKLDSRYLSTSGRVNPPNQREAFAMAVDRFGKDFFDEFQQGVILWENIHARTHLPRDLFDGPFDERWGLDGSDLVYIFCGSGLAALPG